MQHHLSDLLAARYLRHVDCRNKTREGEQEYIKGRVWGRRGTRREPEDVRGRRHQQQQMQAAPCARLQTTRARCHPHTPPPRDDPPLPRLRGSLDLRLVLLEDREISTMTPRRQGDQHHDSSKMGRDKRGSSSSTSSSTRHLHTPPPHNTPTQHPHTPDAGSGGSRRGQRRSAAPMST